MCFSLIAIIPQRPWIEGPASEVEISSYECPDVSAILVHDFVELFGAR